MNRYNTLSLLVFVGVSSTATTTHAHEPARLLQTSGEKIDQQYIVRLTDGSDRQGVMDAVFADMPTASVMYEYDYALNGFTVSGVAEESIMNIADRFPGVVLEVEEDAKSHAVAAPVVWGLDRIDDMNLILDGSFIANVNGEGVDVYILDVSNLFYRFFV
jgi:aqualysin 1